MELIRGVRPMTGQDIEQVADLEQVCFSESWSENLIRMGLDSRLDTYFVYADHGTILGYAVLRILADEGEIQRIGVYPHYRRQGIARKLMDAMVTFARARGSGPLPWRSGRATWEPETCMIPMVSGRRL